MENLEEAPMDLESRQNTGNSAGTKPAKRGRAISLKTALIIIIVGAFCGLTYYYKGVFVAVTVNGSPITRLAVIKQLEKASGKAALDQMVVQKLIEDEVKKKGITINDNEITDEMKNIENQIIAQGGTLADVLSSQGMTQEDFKTQVTIRKDLEKMLGDKIQVTDAEIDKYITDNQITIPAGQEADYKTQIRAQIEQQKFGQEANTFIEALRSQAKITYFVNY